MYSLLFLGFTNVQCRSSTQYFSLIFAYIQFWGAEGMPSPLEIVAFYIIRSDQERAPVYSPTLVVVVVGVVVVSFFLSSRARHRLLRFFFYLFSFFPKKIAGRFPVAQLIRKTSRKNPGNDKARNIIRTRENHFSIRL